MRQKHLFILSTLFLFLCLGCEKDDDTQGTDYAQNVSGEYAGTWVVSGMGQTTGTCTIVKATNTSVNLELTAGGSAIPTLPGVKLSDGGNGIIKLSYTDSSGSLNGSVQNNVLTFTLIAGSLQETFTGTKQ